VPDAVKYGFVISKLSRVLTETGAEIKSLVPTGTTEDANLF
jgi:hypothetical protein